MGNCDFSAIVKMVHCELTCGYGNNRAPMLEASMELSGRLQQFKYKGINEQLEQKKLISVGIQIKFNDDKEESRYPDKSYIGEIRIGDPLKIDSFNKMFMYCSVDVILPLSCFERLSWLRDKMIYFGAMYDANKHKESYPDAVSLIKRIYIEGAFDEPIFESVKK